MCGRLDRARTAAELLRGGLDIGLPDRHEGQIRFNLGFVALATGDVSGCIDMWGRGGEQLAAEDPALARNALWSAGYAATIEHRLDDARSFFERTDGLHQDRGVWVTPLLRVASTVIDVLEGESDTSAMADAFTEVDRLNLRFRTLLAGGAVGYAAHVAGDLDLADRACRSGLTITREMGHLWGAWMLLEYVAWSAAARGAVAHAARVWAVLDGFAEAHGYDRGGRIAAVGRERRDAARSADPDAFDAGTGQGRGRSLHASVDDVLTPER